MRLPDKVVALHTSLEDADIPHAFGGAIALAWCTKDARGTADIDLNVFVPPEGIGDVLNAMPEGIDWSAADRELAERDGQVRIWWDRTPVDLFLSTTSFHDDIVGRVRLEPFEGQELPFLDCNDLAVFKAFFNRGQDWVDLENMHDAGTLDIDAVAKTLVDHLGADDHRIARLRDIGS